MKLRPAVSPLRLGILLVSLAFGGAGQAQTLGEALNATNLNWTTGGAVPWLVETNITHDGEAAVNTGNPALGQANWIRTTVTGPTSVGFWWKVSTCPSDQGSAPLSLYIGGRLQTSIAGEVGWQQRNFYVPAGAQTLQWTFALNCGDSAAQNKGWLDQISFSDPTPLAVLNQPTNQTVAAGDPFSVFVAVVGTEPFAYQWQQGGTNLPGGTGALFSVGDAQAANAGDYLVLVTSPLGSVTSQVATVTVTPRTPIFAVQPASQGAPLGSTVSFTTEAKGSEPLGGWQWYSNGVPVAGATSPVMSIVNVQTSAFGSYWVVVTNAYGSTTSLVATLSFSPVIAWGYTASGQTIVPPSATNVLALAGGDAHCLALRGDGTVVAWGGDYAGQTDVPPDASNIVSIAAGSVHSLALREDGAVLVWGFGSGATNRPAGLTNGAAVGLGPGAHHILTLLKDGTVADWLGSYVDEPGLTNVPIAATNIVSVAAGAVHSLALRADGTVLAWGDNGYSQTAVPASASNVVAISAGFYNNMVLRANGTVVEWGYNSGGVAPPTGLTNIIAIACGGNHRLALRGDGTLFGWGNNYAGQAIPPPWASNVVAIAGASWDSLALVGDGPPLLTSPTINRSVVVGGTTYFRATAVGAWPLAYQWQLYNTNLPEATGAVLAITNAQLAQAGPYSVVVTNTLGSAMGLAGWLTVLSRESVIAADSLTIANGQIGFLAYSPSGLKWSVQASTNLTDWLDLVTLTNSTGTMRFNAPATNFIQRFYRLRLVP